MIDEPFVALPLDTGGEHGSPARHCAAAVAASVVELFAADGAAIGGDHMAVTISDYWCAEGIAVIDEAAALLPIELRQRLLKVRIHLERMAAEANVQPTGLVTCPRCRGSRYEAVSCADGVYETRCLLCDGHGAVARQTAIALAVGLAQQELAGAVGAQAGTTDGLRDEPRRRD